MSIIGAPDAHCLARNVLAFVTAAAALEYWRSPAFTAAMQDTIAHFQSTLRQIAAKYGPGFGVKGRGLMVGLSCPDGATATEISKVAFANGLVVETCGPQGEIVKCLPPLNIQPDTASYGLTKLETAVTK